MSERIGLFSRLVRAFVWVTLRMLYRVRCTGLRNIPKGAAVLAPNHVSYIDAVLIAAHVPRPVHYAMHWTLFNRFRWVVEPLGAFPIAGKENPAIYAAAFDRMGAALDAGELVCIFPEGMLTLDGEMNSFKNGLRKVLRRNPVPVVPVGLRGLWGSYFSRKKRGVFKLPDHFMAKIEMVVGDPVEPTVEMAALQERVRELLG